MDVQGILNRIEERLKTIGMSKEEFYKLSGISSATYSYWNTGKYKPTPRKLRPAADVLGISYFYLLTGEEKKENPTVINGEANYSDSELLNAFKRADEATQELIRRALGLK